jgi:UPF0176 protein
VLKERGIRLGLRGTVLLAPEGINATVAGQESTVKEFLDELRSDPRFRTLETKISVCDRWPFQRWKVRLKKEIVRMKAADADPLRGVGEYVEPCEWNALIASDSTLVIDVRNEHEIAFGTFQGALNPHTTDFWELPGWLESQELERDQPIAMFCTGGIRCERATAYLVARGFRNVRHLRGGILNYLAEIPEEESLWQGTCFVFDERESLDHNLKAGAGGKAADSAIGPS